MLPRRLLSCLACNSSGPFFLIESWSVAILCTLSAFPLLHVADIERNTCSQDARVATVTVRSQDTKSLRESGEQGQSLLFSPLCVCMCMEKLRTTVPHQAFLAHRLESLMSEQEETNPPPPASSAEPSKEVFDSGFVRFLHNFSIHFASLFGDLLPTGNCSLEV
jgi:hypothetical protein